MQLATRQEPAMQTPLALASVQALPHEPQWLLLLARLTSQPFDQSPSQLAKPVLQSCWQVPATQADVAFARIGQALPHAPQLFRSLASVAQAVPQIVWPEGQDEEQAPFAQTVPTGQALPQRPQWAALFRFASQPFVMSPSQLTNPPTQVAIRQAPATQVALALASEQTLPQAPQFVTSLCALTQVGAGAVGVQSSCPTAHVARVERQAHSPAGFASQAVPLGQVTQRETHRQRSLGSGRKAGGQRSAAQDMTSGGSWMSAAASWLASTAVSVLLASAWGL
jgi:hypothetical protein